MPRSAARAHILDASALLALLFDEPGADNVRPLLAGAQLSSVNLTEVLEKLARRGRIDIADIADVTALGIEIVPFDASQAAIAAFLLQAHRGSGMSLADAACLALAVARDAPVLTCDRLWAELDLPLEITVLR